LGGLISLFLASWHPEVFGQCAAISPSVWWEHDLILRLYRSHPKSLRRIRFWIDTGTAEGNSPRECRGQVRRTRLLASTLAAAGLTPEVDFKFLEVAGGEHNERAWAARFDQVLEFLFGQNH
jgi:predicted alpha/beta superfamily hydrolase